MKKIYFLLSLFCFLSFCVSIPSKEYPYFKRTSDQPYISQTTTKAILNRARFTLPSKGELKQKSDGYVYLKVSDDYIKKLFPMLKLPDYNSPDYFRSAEAPGAHISVFYKDESNHIRDLNELGKTYNFKIEQLNVVDRGTYIVLAVRSKGLEDLRKDYGLSPLLHGHDFHITIAKRKRSR